jgi:N-acetylneuraminic acid mutarotase
LIAINHGSASNLHKTDEKDSFYQIKWRQKADLPVPVFAPGIAVIDDKIFVVGGSTIENESQSASDKVYVFDLNKNSWGMASPLPKGIQFPGVAFIDNRIYVIGGCDKEFKEYSSVYEGTFQSPSTTNMDSTRQKDNFSP